MDAGAYKGQYYRGGLRRGMLGVQTMAHSAAGNSGKEVLLQGDCDTSIRWLSKEVGWTEDTRLNYGHAG